MEKINAKNKITMKRDAQRSFARKVADLSDPIV